MIAVLGPKGTFCDKSYEEYNKKYETVHGKSLEPIYCPTIDDVFEQLCTNEACEYAVVPVENMLDGYVQRTLDLLLEKNVYIVDENQVAVQFSLLANAEKIEDIRKIYVQFKTNGQCRQFLHTLHDAEIVTTNSNMESYYKIQDEPGTAAIVHSTVQEAEALHGAAADTDHCLFAGKGFQRFQSALAMVQITGQSKTSHNCKPPKIVRHTQRCAIFHHYVNYITTWRWLQLTYREKKSFYFGQFPQAVGCNKLPCPERAQKNTPKS